MAEKDSISNRDTDEPDPNDVWARLHQKVAVNDAYFHFIDTGKLMPLVEACLASPDDAFWLKNAIEMLESHKGYPWVIKRQVEKARDVKARGRPAEPVWKDDKRLTYMKVAIEKHEQMLRWAGEQKITAAAVIRRIWEMEELPPLTSVERSDLNDTKAINAETSKGLLFPTHKESRAKAIRRALNKLQQNDFVEVHDTSLDLTEKGLLFFRSIDLF